MPRLPGGGRRRGAQGEADTRQDQTGTEPRAADHYRLSASANPLPPLGPRRFYLTVSRSKMFKEAD